ncbi:Required for meiotic nuclear division protein 1 [Orchesella cincta]|uniref:Required for meiotic nuclear division protein 1 n=1 Tax=Orchesella cincta TaxID=48709 RepID=A0A1D2NFN1_ORCCI|nr:Required for meiotic nuclear division protein 1 [Orchesella cincta]
MSKAFRPSVTGFQNVKFYSEDVSQKVADLKIKTEESKAKVDAMPGAVSSDAVKKVGDATSIAPPRPRKVTPTTTPASNKRVKRKTSSQTVIDEYGYGQSYDVDETFPITAYAVCEEFHLKAMRKGLVAQGLYIPTVLSDDLSDVIHVSAKYPIGNEPREIFFFREGAVIFWNVPYLERVNVLKFLKDYSEETYRQGDIEEEVEYMSYMHSDQSATRLLRGKVHLGSDSSNKLLEKYAFANALASSVKLGIWETTLEKYVEGIEHITEALKRAEEIKLTRAEVLQKTGELFALRHQLNLHSDLLDTPDFYWERERLETLYQKTCDYLSINRRTKVMNEKLTQCCELLELVSSHLTDHHHTRLEWMIIVLIMIEVGFEILHLLERYEIVPSMHS